MNKVAKTLFSILRFAMAGGMLYYLINSGSINWSSFIGLISEWPITLLALGLFILGTFFQACRLYTLINAHQLDLTLFSAVRLTFIGLYFNAFLPGANGGDLVKIYYASKGNPGNRTKVVTILLFDRFIGLFSLLTLPLIIAPFFVDLIETEATLQALLGISLIVAIGIVVVSVIGAKIDLANNKLLKWVEQKVILGHLISRVLHTVHSYRNNMGTIFKALAYSYTLQSIMVMVSLVIVLAVNPANLELEMIIFLPLGYMANSLPITPGGLGVGEAALESLFALGGLKGGAETLLGWRIMMILSGIIGLIFFLKGKRRFIYNLDEQQESSGN